MALIKSKAYSLTSVEDYTCTYWRISKVILDADGQSGLVTLKGYKDKQFRLDNGVHSNFKQIEIRIDSRNYTFTPENMALYDMITLAYMAVKTFPYETLESIEVDFSNAQDDIGE